MKRSLNLSKNSRTKKLRSNEDNNANNKEFANTEANHLQFATVGSSNENNDKSTHINEHPKGKKTLCALFIDNSEVRVMFFFGKHEGY